MRTGIAIGLLFTLAASVAAQAPSTDPGSARIITSDIENFWQAYDRVQPDSTLEESIRTFEEHYFEPATPGLREFIRLRIESPEKLVDALTSYPRYYAAIRQNTLRIRAMEPAIREGLRGFEEIYPGAVFPDIYFVIGRLNSGGTASDEALYIGAEIVSSDETAPVGELPEGLRSRLLSADMIPCLVVHELVHYQQDYVEGLRSLLSQALREGIADFLSVKAVGCHATGQLIYSYGEEHERELWEEFREAMHGEDYSGWLYNGRKSADRPADLGYWMGYQIAEAYYEQAEDKRLGVYDLLHIRDFDAFLDASGYAEQFRD